MGTNFGRSPAGPLPTGGSDRFKQAFGDMLTANMDSGRFKPDALAPLLGQPPRRNKGGVGDVLATILAVAADATDPHGRNMHTMRLGQQWGGRRDAYEKELAAYQNRQQMASLPGMNQRELAAYLANPEAWGSNMSQAATSRFGAATLNPGDQRFLGEGNGVYQAPTRGQLYAQSLGLEPGSETYQNAIRDQELGAQGPTAFQNDVRLDDHKTGNQARIEGVRQGNRVSLEGVRQGNRVNLKRIPAPPRLGGRENLPVVRTPQEAMALPPGTKFRTPDGRIKIR
jgi:hypothetical protein